MSNKNRDDVGHEKRSNIRNDIGAINRLSLEEVIRDDETLTMAEFCIRIFRDRDWVIDNFVEPKDENGEPLVGPDGESLGLPIAEFGRWIAIHGRTFNRWIAERSKPRPPKKRRTRRKAGESEE